MSHKDKAIPLKWRVERRAPDGTLICKVTAKVERDGWWSLWGIKTHPDYLRQGHALALARRLIDQARQAGAPGVWTRVRFDNAPSIALNTRLGLTPGAHGQAREDGEDRILFNLAFAAPPPTLRQSLAQRLLRLARSLPVF